MAVQFINQFSEILSMSNGENTTTEVCVEQISHYDWYQFALIPAFLVTLALSITKKRRNLLLHVFSGRPGLIYPMDTLTRSSRISYACAFGATAFLVYSIILNQTAAIDYTGGNRTVKTFVLIGSMFIYGMVFFPLFASLAVGSVYGYLLGTLYIWMLTILEVYRVFQCPAPNSEANGLLFARGLPNFLCLLYLCVSLPVRMVMAWRRGHYFCWREDREVSNSIEDIQDSYVGHYVTKLFRKPKVKLPPETRKGRIIAILQSLVHRFIYKRKRGFRYPARILSIFFVAFIVIYTLTFQFLTLFPRIVIAVIHAMQLYIDRTLGPELLNEIQDKTVLRNFLFGVIKILEVLKICIYVSVSVASLFAVLNILHALSSYRANLFALYRGDHSRIPAASFSSTTSHCIGSIKYGGFQVGYMVWSYLILLGIMFLVSFVLGMLILLILYDMTTYIVLVLAFLWPIVLTLLIVLISHFLLAKLVFLQEWGALLALDNRSVYFTFTYFMFFYNVFLGLVSCLVRIMKAMAVGVVFLGRLDSSTLPRRFEFIDPGFKAYVGYMHVEVAHTHPVLVVFCRLMLLGMSNKRDREAGKVTKENILVGVGVKNNRVHANGNGFYNPLATTTTVPPKSEGFDDNGDKEAEEEDFRRRRRVAARFNWHVTYTLLFNPEIRVMRKGYLHTIRQARAMGVYIPISDRQADVDFDHIQGIMAEARKKLNPTTKKCTKYGGGEGESDAEGKELKVVLTSKGESRDGKKATTTTMTNVETPDGRLELESEIIQPAEQATSDGPPSPPPPHTYL